jgi:hypothetical protein
MREENNMESKTKIKWLATLEEEDYLGRVLFEPDL